MHRIGFLLALFAPSLAGAETPPAGTLAAEATLGGAITVDRITVFPLLAKGDSKPGKPLITLDEAIDQDRLSIKEKDTSGSVNTLHVTNTSDKVIFAMAGEVVLGGKQDRIVGRNTLIPPGVKDFAIDVFCVEHGRWQHQTAKFESARTMAHLKLRQKAYKGSQGEVWQEVAATNARRKSTNATDTYRAAIKRTSSTSKVASLVKRLLAATKAHAGMAGLVIAYNGEVQAADWFARPDLYRRLEPKLLTSYVTQALDSTDGKRHASPAKDKASGWLKRAGKARRKGRKSTKSGETWGFDDEAVDGTLSTDKAGVVHEGYIKK